MNRKENNNKKTELDIRSFEKNIGGGFLYN